MNRAQLLRSGILVEVILLAISLGIVAVWSIPVEKDPLRTVTGYSLVPAWGLGLLAGTVLSLWFVVAWWISWSPFRQIRNFILETLGRPLLACRPEEVLLLAVFAGVGEEVLFRGVLEPRIGLIATNAIFGLMHPITMTYAIVATTLGVILSFLQYWSGNLWTPLVAHAWYDYIAFLIVIRTLKQQGESAEPEQE